METGVNIIRSSILYLYKKGSSVDDLVELLNLDESSREVIEYFKNKADFYQKKNSVPFHLSGYQVISKKSKYSDDVLFTASIKNLDLYCDGVTEEQAIKKLEEEYNKNLSYKLLDNIMNDYPITIGTKSS